jgi:hypothetical protein
MCAHTPSVVSFRYFLCVECGVSAAICPRCDRGQTTCGAACARSRRQRLQRQSNRRYQRTHQGARAHARRQALYRKRRAAPDVASFLEPGAQKVTEQGSPTAAIWPESVTAPHKTAREGGAVAVGAPHPPPAQPTATRGVASASAAPRALNVGRCIGCGVSGSGFLRTTWLRRGRPVNKRRSDD